jgi:hypothetical protein
VNGAEIGSPGEAPGSISYNAYLNDDGTMSVSVEVADGGWWSYLLTR